MMKSEECPHNNETDFISAVLQGLDDIEKGRVMSLATVKARFQVVN